MSAHDDVTASLAEAAARTLEDMCFLYAMPLLSDEQREAPAEAAMSVRFRGPMSGRLVVRVAGGALPMIATNMLGDAVGSAAMQQDALGEVANVVCGNLLPMIGGTADVYSIDSAEPVIVIERTVGSARAVVQLGLEDSARADLMLFLDAA